MSWITGIFTATYRYYQNYFLQGAALGPSLNDTGLTIEMNFQNPKGNIELNFQNPQGLVEVDFPDLIDVDDV